MTATTNNTNKPESNSQLAADYLAKMKADLAKIQALIDLLKGLVGENATLQQDLQFAMAMVPFFGLGPVNLINYMIDAVNAAISKVEGELNALDPGLASFDNAIAALENGENTVIGNGDDTNQDLAMFSSYLDQLCQAMEDKAKADEYRGKLAADGDNNNDLLKDAVQAARADAEEGSVLAGLQAQMSNDIVKLNGEKTAAQTDLDSYTWWDDFKSFGGDESAKDADRWTIRNADDMIPLITAVMSAIAPEIAAAQNEVYATAALAMNKILEKVLKLLENTNLSPQQKGDQIKYLMALALGILSMIQSDAAQQKAKDQQTEAKSANFATQMNISNQNAELQQLENALSFASTMGLIMKIAKPIMEIGGMLLAPGVGSFLVMALMAIADEAGLTDKLTAEVAKIPGLGSIGAEVLVGAIEVGVTLGGGMALDKQIAKAAAKAAVVAAEEAAEVSAKVIEETSAKALSSANKVGDETAAIATRNVVTSAVENGAKTAAKKTVQMFNNECAATLIPRLLKTAWKEGTLDLATVMAKACEEDCLIAAKKGAEIAGEDITFFAEAAAKGAVVTQEMIDDVSTQAANKAVASVLLTSAETVGKVTLERSAARTAVSRGVWSAAYVALSDGALSSATEAALKKAGKKEDDKEFIAIMDTIKIIESILASMALMYGSGMLQATISNAAPSTLLKLGAFAQIAVTGANAVALGGQAQADEKQADAVKAINESSVSNDMLQMYLQQFNQQASIDEKLLQSQMAEQASNYRMISQLENNIKEAAIVLSQQAV